MATPTPLSFLGPDISEIEEETFLLFSLPQPSSQNLGYLSNTHKTLDITVGTRDLQVRQSPTLLSSKREMGTTGAVIWRVTPLFAEWLASKENCLFARGLVESESTVLELGCGVSGVVALVTAPRVRQYVCTDQEYVLKILRENIAENATSPRVAQLNKSSASGEKKGKSKPNSTTREASRGTIETLALDWENSAVSDLPRLLSHDRDPGFGTIDLVVACDCVYNEALIEPFVGTCADVCRLNKVGTTVCVVAQQLRSDVVFEAWLRAFGRSFNVWRIPDELLTEGLRSGSGFIVHAGLLRST